MSSYKTLEVEKRYLGNFGALAAEAADGITRADLDACETWAFNLIAEEFARAGFDVTDWTGDDIPPAVADLADELASAKAWELKFAREGAGLPGAIGGIVEGARDRVRRLCRSGLVDGSGGRIASDSPSVMRVRNPE